MYLDECHFYRHGTRYRMWVPPEDTDPVVLQEPTRKGIIVFGAVDPYSGVLSRIITEKYNAVTFRAFLMSISPVSGKIHMVLDNAKYHHANQLKDFPESNPHIILEFLPPYSPELNPIERVWKLIKSKGTHNRYFPSVGELIWAVTEQFDVYDKSNNTLMKLCAIT